MRLLQSPAPSRVSHPRGRILPMHPDNRLEITLSATISRHQWDTDPTRLVAELHAIADGRGDLLAKTAGLWAGYHHTLTEHAPVRQALLTIPGATDWAPTGQQRADAPTHAFHRRTDADGQASRNDETAPTSLG
jgi:hypothetical protein